MNPLCQISLAVILPQAPSACNKRLSQRFLVKKTFFSDIGSIYCFRQKTEVFPSAVLFQYYLPFAVRKNLIPINSLGNHAQNSALAEAN